MSFDRYAIWRENPDVWIPYWKTTEVNEVGADWPISVLVEKWEENGRGEKRYIGMEQYVRNPEP